MFSPHQVSISVARFANIAVLLFFCNKQFLIKISNSSWWNLVFASWVFQKWILTSLYRTHRYAIINYCCIIKSIFTLKIHLQSQNTIDERVALVDEISLWLESHLSNDSDVSLSCFISVIHKMNLIMCCCRTLN